MNSQTTKQETTNTTARLLCKKIWKSALEYTEATRSPQDSYCTSFFWSAFLYSVRDLLDQKAITSSVQDHFIYIAAQLYDIPPTDVERLSMLKQYQTLAFQNLCASQVNPRSKEGIAEILCIATIISTPEGEAIPDVPPDPEHIMEFMGAVTDLTAYTATVLSKVSIPPVAPVTSPVLHTEPTLPPKTKNKKIRFDWFTWMCIAVIVFCSIFLALCVSHYTSQNQDSDPRPTSTVLSSNPSETTLQLVKAPIPYNGEILKYAADEMVAPLTITTYGKDYYYFVLLSVGSEESEMSFFVHGNSTVDVLVPLGSYNIYYASGEVWYGVDELFGPETTYQRFDDFFPFAEDVEGYSGWTVQLQPVTYGNLDSEYVSPEDFPN